MQRSCGRNELCMFKEEKDQGGWSRMRKGRMGGDRVGSLGALSRNSLAPRVREPTRQADLYCPGDQRSQQSHSASRSLSFSICTIKNNHPSLPGLHQPADEKATKQGPAHSKCLIMRAPWHPSSPVLLAGRSGHRKS